jgi:hypothetical protein
VVLSEGIVRRWFENAARYKNLKSFYYVWAVMGLFSAKYYFMAKMQLLKLLFYLG